jgi:outer membrane protein assembly factor BamC
MKLFSAYLTRPLLLLSSALFLSSCGLIGGDSAWFGGENGLFADEGGYQAAQVIPDMRIPAELDSYTIDQLYVIPEPFSADAEAFEEIPLPRPIEERRREGVVIQSLAGVRWILIDATPGQVWPLIRDRTSDCSRL